MANHEIRYKCWMCGHCYDVRLETECPECGTVSRYASRTDEVNADVLKWLWFEEERYFDRDFADFDNIEVVDWRMHIAADCALVLSEYRVAESPGKFELKERTAELVVGDSSVELVFNDSAELLGLMAKLKKMVKH